MEKLTPGLLFTVTFKGCIMKTYQVELQRVSYVTLTIEAENSQAAEDAAWLELQRGDYDCNDAEWNLIYVEEEQGVTA